MHCNVWAFSLFALYSALSLTRASQSQKGLGALETHIIITTTTIITDQLHGAPEHLTFDCDGGQGLLAAQYVQALADVLALVLVLYVTDT